MYSTPNGNKLGDKSKHQLTAALSYVTRGWTIIPIQYGLKHPNRKGWQHTGIHTEDAAINTFGTGTLYNIGVILGQRSGNLYDYDLDHPLAARVADGLLPATFTFGREGKPRSHRFVLIECDSFKTLTRTFRLSGTRSELLVELRGDGGQTIVPPSCHEDTGETIRVEEDVELIKLTPDEATEYLNFIAAGTLIAILWPKGARHRVVGALTGWLLKSFWDRKDVERFVRAVLNAVDDEELHDRLRYMEDTIQKFQNGDEVTGYVELAETFDDKVLKQIARWLGIRKPRDVDLDHTDAGNARRLVDRYTDDITFCPELKSWYAWDGRRWAEDVAGRVHELAEETIRAFAVDAAALPRQQAGNAFDWARQSLNDRRLTAMVERAGKSVGEIKVTLNELDTDGWLLNVANGTIDLRTGELKRHDRNDRITKLAPVEYHPGAPFHAGERFLYEVFAVKDDETGEDTRELVEFIQRLVGLTLIGTHQEAVLPIAYGLGRNGKGTFFEVLRKMLGDYAIRAPRELFYQYHHERHPTEIADLMGVRFAFSNEGDQQRQLAEAKIKDITGGEEITARRMHQDYQRFTPTHTLWLATNHKPIIVGTDRAIWERVKFIPFTVSFVDNPDPSKREKQKDNQMKEKLLGELEGWLAWAVQGCLAYQRVGLSMPRVVRDATLAFRNESDQLGQWISDHCVEARTSSGTLKSLWESYREWAMDNSDTPLKKGQFREQLEARGLRIDKGHSNRLYVYGLEIRRSEYRMTGPSPNDYDDESINEYGELTLERYVSPDAS